MFFTHPVIFDYFLNNHGIAFFQTMLEIKDYYPVARFRIDLLEVLLIDCYSNLDSTDKLKVKIERVLDDIFKLTLLSESVYSGN